MLSLMRTRIYDLFQSLLQVDKHLTAWMADNGILLLRLSLGIVYFWFGTLKFFSGLSPAEELAQRTIEQISFGLLSPKVSLYLLAFWECLIGLGLIFGVLLRPILILLWLQMVGAIMPLFLFPEVVFYQKPFVPTMEGQYIIKNLVLISAGIVIGATVRGGHIIPEPESDKAEYPGDKIPDFIANLEKE